MSVRWRADRGRWEVKWREHDRQRSRLFRFEQDATDFDNELYRRKRMGFTLPFDQGHITLATWGEQAWGDYLAPSLAPATRKTYAYQWDKHVLPSLGAYELRELDAGVINRFQVDMRRRGAGDPTIRRVMALLQGMLRYAVIDGHIAANPVAVVGRPRQQSADWPEPVPPVLVERVLDAMPHPRDRMLVALVAYAGLRPGEALRARVEHVRGAKMRVTATKRTPRRNRVVDVLQPLGDDLAVFLAGRQTGPIVTRSDGRAFTDTSWRNWRRRVWLEYGAPLLDGDTRLYRMRGSFASLLAWEGRPITYVAGQLGHSVETCSRYYLGLFEQFEVGHAVPAAKAIQAARADATLPVPVPHTFPS